nr:hypothetical protein GCM10020093_088590 [Planobispora longispora]
MFELVHGHVGGQVVDAVERHAQAQGVRLGRGHPDQQRPGQAGAAVTAIASMSDRRRPACSRARSTVGVIASRCAREATSGTTPPKRACSSTLEAMVLASRV